MKVKSDLLEEDELIELQHPLAVIDRTARHRSELSAALRRAATGGSFVSVDAFDEATEPGQAAVIVLGPSASRSDGLDQLGRLLRSRPEVKAIMVVDTLSTDLLQTAIRVGVTDVVLHGSIGDELVDAVMRADHMVSAADQPDYPELDGGVGPGRSGRVTTVFSPKGGSGKSVVATNLAVALAKRGPNPVVLLDADLQFGDVAVMLHMNPRHTLQDVVEAMDHMDVNTLRSMLDAHESGVLVLAAPVEPSFAERVTPDDLATIVNLLRSFAAHVVIDTPTVLNDTLLGLIERSDDVVVVGGMDIPTVKNVKVGLQTLRLLDVPVNRLRLVLNRANTKVKMEVQEVERALQLRADALIPSDILVPTSMNKGVTAVVDVPRSAVARAFNQLADLLLAGTRR
jgi:pilus assembly protein CpaE